MNQKEEGILAKFAVHRLDGKDQPGGKHEGCWYWVLDPTHDPFAIPALRAYAEACRLEYPKLYTELLDRIAAYSTEPQG